MFWSSAALELKSSRPPRTQAYGGGYGSFSRTSSSSSIHIPQSIPEHQPLCQFTSPRTLTPAERARVEAEAEADGGRAAAVARTRAALELPASTQSALKLLLQGGGAGNFQSIKRSESGGHWTPSEKKAVSASRDMYSMSKIHSYNAGKPLMKTKSRHDSGGSETSALLAGAARAAGEEPNPQEHELEEDEHNYWMLERERRRRGLQKSRRRTCTPLTERATTSPLKVGLVMCSVPFLLVLAFVIFVVVFDVGGDASQSASVLSTAVDVVNGLLYNREPAREPQDRRYNQERLPHVAFDRKDGAELPTVHALELALPFELQATETRALRGALRK